MRAANAPQPEARRSQSHAPSSEPQPQEEAPSALPEKLAGLTISEEAPEDQENDEDDELNQSIDAKIAAARSRLSPTHCLFCTSTSPSLPDNLTHMSSAHSFFVPDAEYLIDLPGLITGLEAYELVLRFVSPDHPGAVDAVAVASVWRALAEVAGEVLKLREIKENANGSA